MELPADGGSKRGNGMKRMKREVEWIPVGERLPETDEKVICLARNKKGDLNAVMGYYADHRWCCGMNSNIAYWMPVPALPEV